MHDFLLELQALLNVEVWAVGGLLRCVRVFGGRYECGKQPSYACRPIYAYVRLCVSSCARVVTPVPCVGVSWPRCSLNRILSMAGTASAPFCDVCAHYHEPTEVCPVCGHRGGERKYRGPPPTTLHFKFAQHPGKNKGRKFEVYQAVYSFVPFLRAKVREQLVAEPAAAGDEREFGLNAHKLSQGVVEFPTDADQEARDMNAIHCIGYVGHALVMVGSVSSTLVGTETFAYLEHYGIVPSYRKRHTLEELLTGIKSYVLELSSDVRGFLVACKSQVEVDTLVGLGFLPEGEPGNGVVPMLCRF